MLMHMFDTSDYDRSLRRRRLMALGLLAVGITGIVCYIRLIHNSEVLSDYARGFIWARPAASRWARWCS